MTYTSNSKKLPLRLNLQFFSEETHPFAADVVQNEPHPFAAEPHESSFAQFTDTPNPLIPNNQVPDTPQLQPEGQGPGEVEPVIQKLDFGGREVEVVDPIIHDLHKDYSALTRTYQQTNQELLQARQLAEQWQQLAQQQQPAQQPEPPQQHSQGTEISVERQQELNEEYMERMYENKFEADQWWNSQPEVIAQNRERLQAEFQAELNQRLEPIEKEREALQAQQQANEFIQSHPDFETYREAMQDVLNDNPYLEDLPNALDVLYSMAKVRHTPETPSFENMLNDPQYQQKILENEQIKNLVFQQYQQSKMQTNNQLPNVMGNPVGSQTPYSAGEQSPRTLSEATNNWLRQTGQI